MLYNYGKDIFMTIDEILEMMDDLLDKSVSVPFSNKKSMVDVELMREYIDGIRYNLPTEIKKAKEMVYDRSQIITDAKSEAESIIKRAEERAKILVSGEEIVKLAKERANEIVTNAQTADREIRLAMGERMDEMLNNTESELAKNLSEIKKLRVAIKASAKKPVK